MNGWKRSPSTDNSLRPKRHSSRSSTVCESSASNDHRHMSIRGLGPLAIEPGALHRDNNQASAYAHIPIEHKKGRNAIARHAPRESRVLYAHRSTRSTLETRARTTPKEKALEPHATPVGYHCFRLDNNALPEWGGHELAVEMRSPAGPGPHWSTPPPVMQGLALVSLTVMSKYVSIPYSDLMT